MINKNSILILNLEEKITRQKDSYQSTLLLGHTKYYAIHVSQPEKKLQKDQNPFNVSLFFSFQGKIAC